MQVPVIIFGGFGFTLEPVMGMHQYLSCILHLSALSRYASLILSSAIDARAEFTM